MTSVVDMRMLDDNAVKMLGARGPSSLSRIWLGVTEEEQIRWELRETKLKKTKYTLRAR